MPNSLQYIPFYNTPVGVYILFFSSFANNAQGINTPAHMQAVWSRVQIWKMSFSKSQAGDLTTRPFFFNSPVYQTDLHLAAYLICAVMLTDSSWTSGLPAAFLCGLAISTCSNTNRTILHSAKCITESSTSRRNEGTEHLDDHQCLVLPVCTLSQAAVWSVTQVFQIKKQELLRWPRLLVFEPLPPTI